MEEWDVEKAEELSNQLATREVSQTDSDFLSALLLFSLPTVCFEMIGFVLTLML